jgi:hypothetical protein
MKSLVPIIATLALASAPLQADVWESDNTPDASSNELVHGASQDHDLAAVAGTPDVDSYHVTLLRYNSYEAGIASLSNCAANPGPGAPAFELVDGSGEVAKTATSTPSGYAKVIRWEPESAAFPPSFDVTSEYTLRVTSTCTTCTSSTTYNIRFYNTTASVARFNNTATQRTVLILQNPGPTAVTGNIYFWSTAGVLLATQPISIAAHGAYVLATASLAALADKSGSLTVAHTGGYGGLSGKAVALEPATGFSFDTPLTYQPH